MTYAQPTYPDDYDTGHPFLASSGPGYEIAELATAEVLAWLLAVVGGLEGATTPAEEKQVLANAITDLMRGNPLGANHALLIKLRN